MVKQYLESRRKSCPGIKRSPKLPHLVFLQRKGSSTLRGNVKEAIPVVRKEGSQSKKITDL